MDKPTTWTPCRELELASTRDATPNANPEALRVQWKNALASRILEALPHPIAIDARGPYNRNQLTSELVAIVVDVVGQADEVLHELSEKLDEARAELTRRTTILAERDQQIVLLHEAIDTANELAELQADGLEQASGLCAQYEADCDRLKTAAIVQRLELERARDQLQEMTIKLAGAQARITAAEDAERKLRGGN